MEYKYTITETHINIPEDPSSVCLHETYTSAPIAYDGNDLVIPMENGFTVRPNCPPNETDRYLQTGAAEIRLRNVKRIVDLPGFGNKSPGKTPFVGQGFTFLGQTCNPDTGVFTLETHNLHHGQVVFEIHCDAVEYRFNEFTGDSWREQVRNMMKGKQ